MPDLDPGDYCRSLEAYLCRKNDGHLIRIVGPAFEKVCGWARQGIPFKIACRGIDRYFERYYAKGPRRRPVRIEFCEADILDAFDDWRRAVGVLGAGVSPAAPAPAPASLPAHLQRVLQKLTDARARAADERAVAAVDQAIDAIEEVRPGARTLRGEARAAAIQRLAAIERELVAAIRGATPIEDLDALRREAESELAGFAARIPREAYQLALTAAVDRLLRERAGLPRIRYE
ncbi:MAG TPA: hypothetical protein VK886_05450 [Vicinamibacterales bacterium]|nr:hypothetical protein [Vicinamibacterales bacterium]